MSGDGKFNHGKYTTIPETKNIKLPIGGKIRLGIRIKNEEGITYPLETKYFVCPEEVRDVYGDEPTELIVFFPRANREEVFPQAYEKYGSNNALLCKGDGEVSKTAQRLNLENGRWEDVVCPCEHYQKYDPKTKKGGCNKVGHLFFMIPSVSIGTFYECSPHGTVSISELNSAFQVAEVTTGGCWAMIPFRMRRVAKKLKIPGTAKMKTHWVVTLEVAASAEEIKRVKKGEILYLGQRKDGEYELEAPGLPIENRAYVAQETEEEVITREAEAAKKKEALLKEYEESKAKTAQLEKEIEEGKHDLKPYKDAKVIYKKENGEEGKVVAESEENNLATDPQKKTIYGDVICEECGTKVYGFKCTKCKNTDLHIIKEGFFHDPLMTRTDFEKEMKPTIYPFKLTAVEADKIIFWWKGNKKEMTVGERIRRESKEKVVESIEPIIEGTKAERIKVAQEIVSRPGKLEIKDENTLFPGEKEEPGSSPKNAIEWKGGKKELKKISKGEDFIAPK